MRIWIDDERFDRPEDAKVSIFDHGFLFGDSVYEVCRTHGGRPYQVEPHLHRLEASAQRISLDLGHTREELAHRIETAVRASGVKGEAYVRLIVTRGVGALNIDPATCRRPTVILIVKTLNVWPARFYDEGVRVQLVGVRRNARSTVDPSIKTGNYLNNILAIVEARGAGADDALMENVAGQLTECTTSNLFFVRGGTLCTPSLDQGILSGITRSDVLRLARADGMDVREGTFEASELRGAAEAFITSTTRGAMPVASVDDAPIGAPGRRPVTARVQALLAQEAVAFRAQIPPPPAS